VFFGTFTHTIDAKGRTALPVKLREALAAAGEPRIVLMRSPLGRSVMALPYSTFKRAADSVMAASPFDALVQRNVLRTFSTAHEVDLDQSGRVLVPPDLREWAALSKDVVWVGMGPHLLLYDKATHQAEMEQEIPEDQRWDPLKGR
jgi:MraZ protein